MKKQKVANVLSVLKIQAQCVQIKVIMAINSKDFREHKYTHKVHIEQSDTRHTHLSSNY